MIRNLMLLFINVFSLYKPIKFVAILYPTSLANLVVEVGTRHSHQILLQRYHSVHGADFELTDYLSFMWELWSADEEYSLGQL